MGTEGRWFVADARGAEVSETRGASKSEAQDKHVAKMQMLRGERKPWVWWANHGFRVRRER